MHQEFAGTCVELVEMPEFGEVEALYCCRWLSGLLLLGLLGVETDTRVVHKGPQWGHEWVCFLGHRGGHDIPKVLTSMRVDAGTLRAQKVVDAPLLSMQKCKMIGGLALGGFGRGHYVQLSLQGCHVSLCVALLGKEGVSLLLNGQLAELLIVKFPVLIVVQNVEKALGLLRGQLHS